MTRDWDKHLGNILASFDGDTTLDRDDKAIQAVLIALHKAVRGQIDLTELAIACIEFDWTYQPTEARR